MNKFTVLIGVAFVLATTRAQSAPKPEPYLPLACAVVDVSAGRLSTLVQTITRFADQRHLRVIIGGYPKFTRSVSNLELHFGRDSYFYGSNFLDANNFVLIARSHEDDAVWRPVWHDFITYVSVEFGNIRIAACSSAR